MEIQLLDDAAPQYKYLGAEHRNGSIYSFVAPRKVAGTEGQASLEAAEPPGAPAERAVL